MIPPTFWITGLSASGKTTLSEKLAQSLASTRQVDLLDGEELRRRLSGKYGHSLADRQAILQEYVDIAKESRMAGNVVILATISHKLEMRQYARTSLHPYFEIYLKADVSGCASRDKKGHYTRVLGGSNEYFAGISEPYEEGGADLVLSVEEQDENEIFDRALTFAESVLS